MEKEHFEVLLEEIRGQLQLLAEGHMTLVARFDGVDARFDGVDARFDKMDRRFDGVDARLDKMDRRFDRLESEVRTGFANVAEGLAAYDQRIGRLEKWRRSKRKAKKAAGRR